MNTNHTPGPWVIDEEDMQQDEDTVFSIGIWSGEVEGRSIVAHVSAFGLHSETHGSTEVISPIAAGQREIDEAKANAILIAAAPLLLDALRDAEMRIRSYLDLLNCDEEFKATETKMIRAAIATATN